MDEPTVPGPRAALLDTVSRLPNLPGVYRYFDAQDTLCMLARRVT
jgi:excinuclease ABC subunit C